MQSALTFSLTPRRELWPPNEFIRPFGRLPGLRKSGWMAKVAQEPEACDFGGHKMRDRRQTFLNMKAVTMGIWSQCRCWTEHPWVELFGCWSWGLRALDQCTTEGIQVPNRMSSSCSWSFLMAEKLSQNVRAGLSVPCFFFFISFFLLPFPSLGLNPGPLDC